MQYTIDANGEPCRLTLSGTMANRDLLDLEGLIMGIDESSSVAPNWLVDLRSLSNMEIDYRSVSGFAHVLGRCSLMNTERVALLGGTQIQYGFARMFQIISENWQVEVGLFENEKDALDWLSNQAQ
jgi:hypothetical protein